jgi:hypothetical protein
LCFNQAVASVQGHVRDALGDPVIGARIQLIVPGKPAG